ncbi:MAG: hypothetical protein AAF939_17050 [Planctomycetota bacterium]
MRIHRSFFLALALAVSWICIVNADVTVNYDPDNDGSIYRYQLTVTPAAESVPAFKHRLVVEPENTIAGNAITHYLRSLGERSLDAPLQAARARFGEKFYTWYELETPETAIPVGDLKSAVSLFEFYVENHLKRATKCRDADWGLALEDLRGPETIEFLLPSVQQTRSMARILLLRNRLALLEGRFKDSVESIRMIYKLGQNVNELKFLVAGLVGTAEVGMANGAVLQLIGTKDSPNMYWSLAELETPIIDIRESLRLERSLGMRYLKELDGIESKEYTDEKWNELLQSTLDSIFRVVVQNNPGPEVIKLKPSGLALASYSTAKRRLAKSGFTSEQLESMSVAQLILIDGTREYRRITDECEKMFYVPFDRVAEFETELNRLQRPTQLGEILAETFLPAAGQIRYASARTQAQLNALMVIESLRHHAAKTGQFPNSLDELTLPVRIDPITNLPFPYRNENGTAYLEHAMNRSLKAVYEIKLAK